MTQSPTLPHTQISDASLNQLFRDARTHSRWSDKPVSDEILATLYQTLCMGPTSMNNSPGRFLFVKSDEAKARLRPHLMAGNVDKTMAAPVTVIVAWDREFYEQMPKLWPHGAGARDMMAAGWESNGIRNGTLQGGYLILAARALGLDVGPMSGFSIEGVDGEFFGKGSGRESWTANFLVNLGYGTGEGLHPRLERLSFDEAAAIV